jgi:hypothetical protein
MPQSHWARAAGRRRDSARVRTRRRCKAMLPHASAVWSRRRIGAGAGAPPSGHGGMCGELARMQQDCSVDTVSVERL